MVYWSVGYSCTCPLLSLAVYSAVGPLSPVKGQKEQVTKYFISQVKHAHPSAEKSETDHSDECAIRLIKSLLAVQDVHGGK